MKALVTGGAGFIGSHLVERLLREDWRVRVLDNLSTGSWSNIPLGHPLLEVEEGDVRREVAVQRACAGMHTVFHLAALPSVAGSVEDPLTSHSVNALGTLNVLTAARDQGVRRFVFSSSASIYGNSDVLPTGEEQPMNPQSPYASEKALGEFYCRNFWELFGLETVILRYFNVFGPRQNHASGYAAAIPLFVHSAVTGQPPIVYGDGLQTRDFVYVGNVVDANLRAATTEGVAGQAFNIAGGTGLSILNLLEHLEEVSGRRLEPEFRPARAGEVRHSVASISRARRLLGYHPTVTFGEGLQRSFEAVAAVSRSQQRALAAA